MTHIEIMNEDFNRLYAAAPKEEPQRQKYFIKLLKEGLSERAEAGLTSCTVTFGCQMNARDSEKLTGILSAIGFTDSENEEAADLVIFNTCTIRENANEHLYGRLGRLKQSKSNKPDKIIAVCGCMMQEKDEVEKLKVKYPYVDIIFGTHNFHTFPELLCLLLGKRAGLRPESFNEGRELLTDSSEDTVRYDKLMRYTGSSSFEKDMHKLSRKPVVSVWRDSSEIVEELPSIRKFPFKQGINIMFGCNNFCSYCIVPYVRGREKSRAPEDIYRDVRKAGEEGVKEIMLLGQNVNSYSGGVSFAKLLKSIDDICDECGIQRIRFMTSHPKDLTDELIEVMAGGKHICRQFHLPLQSGSSRILALMNRKYDKERFLERATKLKAAMPDISISTDIIVGFPGETEEDFEETLEVMRKVRFDQVYSFIYSRREGTPAAKMEPNAGPDEISARFKRLTDLQAVTAEENLRSAVGSVKKVLFECVSEYDEAYISGKLESGITVHVPGGRELIGSERLTELTECRGFYYYGKVI